jgi:prophage regulatory protein
MSAAAKAILNSRASTPCAGEQLLPLREVAKIVGLSRSTVNKKIAAGKFPRPIKPSGNRCSRWLASEIQGYIADAVIARDCAQSPTVPA